jgi:hypothetical protein
MIWYRTLACLSGPVAASVLTFNVLAGQDSFRFAPTDGTTFVRTLTRTARIEVGGMMRIEKTIFRARFTFHEVSSGFRLTMRPLSFVYIVNDRETPSPVWELIRGHELNMYFNVVGKLTDVSGIRTDRSRTC